MWRAVLSTSTIAAALDLVDDCGAIVKKGVTASVEETLHNAEAIKSCLQQANDNSAELGPDAKTVVLAKDYVIASMGLYVQDL